MTLLKAVLEFVEPVVFNKYNIMSITKRGLAKQNRDMLLELLVFSCNIKITSGLDADTWAELKGNLRRRYLFLGSRAEGLVLPPDWSIHGIFDLQMKENTVMVMHKFLANQPVVQVDLPEKWEPARLTLIDNFPEESATITDPQEEVVPIRCASLFQSVQRTPDSGSSLRRKRSFKDLEAGAFSTPPLKVRPQSLSQAFEDAAPGAQPSSSASAASKPGGSAASQAGGLAAEHLPGVIAAPFGLPASPAVPDTNTSAQFDPAALATELHLVPPAPADTVSD